MSLKDELVRFIRQDLLPDDSETPIQSDTPLIDSGVVSSLQLMQLVTFIEERAAVRVPDDEVLPDNFQSVDDIVAMVERLRART